MKPHLTLAAFCAMAPLARASAAIAGGCSSQSYPTAVCVAWAPISGDPDADRCTVAKLDAARLADDYDPARPRTVADEPLPDHGVMLDRLKAAADRVARDCARDDAGLQ